MRHASRKPHINDFRSQSFGGGCLCDHKEKETHKKHRQSSRVAHHISTTHHIKEASVHVCVQFFKCILYTARCLISNISSTTTTRYSRWSINHIRGCICALCAINNAHNSNLSYLRVYICVSEKRVRAQWFSRATRSCLGLMRAAPKLDSPNRHNNNPHTHARYCNRARLLTAAAYNT